MDNGLNKPGNPFGDIRIILRHEWVVAGEKQFRRRDLGIQLVKASCPPSQIHNESAGPIVFIIFKEMGAIGTKNGGSFGCIDSHGLQGGAVTRGKKTFYSWQYFSIAFDQCQPSLRVDSVKICPFKAPQVLISFNDVVPILHPHNKRA